MEKEISVICEQLKDLSRRTDKVETISEYQQKELQRILEAQATTKVQIENLITKIDKMESNLMAPIRDIAESLSKNQHNSSTLKGGGTTKLENDKLLDLLKWTIGGTIVVLVAWMVATNV